MIADMLVAAPRFSDKRLWPAIWNDTWSKTYSEHSECRFGDGQLLLSYQVCPCRVWNKLEKVTRGTQMKTKLPRVKFEAPWATPLDQLCRSKGFPAGRRDKALPNRTIRNALTDGSITETSFAALGAKLGFDTIAKFQAWLDGAANPAPPLIREIRKRAFQEITSSERPKPAPPPGKRPLIAPRGYPDSEFVEGWTIRLKAGVRYKFEYESTICWAWLETETVLYVGVPAGSVPDVWKRFKSAGALSTVATDPEFIAQSENFFVTCWGRRVLTSQSPRKYFCPVDFSEDATGSKLTLRFSSPPVNDADSESCPVVRISAVR